jgi:hypothetical protein
MDLHSIKMIFKDMVKCPAKLQNGVQLSLQKTHIVYKKYPILP